jgi:peptidoglycan/LPS O-acetylase OafA/YrhL
MSQGALSPVLRIDPTPSAPAATGPAKLEYLDGLRGIAAAMVVLTHFRAIFLGGWPVPGVGGWPVPGTLGIPSWLAASPLRFLFFGGDEAVIVFFVHSGFVLSWKYVLAHDNRLLISMALRRIPRLGIPVAVAVLFSFALLRYGWSQQLAWQTHVQSRDFVGLFSSYPPPLSDALKDAFGGALFYGGDRFCDALWTMSVELVCSYFVFVALPFVVRVSIAHWVLYVGLLAAAVMQPYPWLVCFAIGVLLARLHGETTIFQLRPAADVNERWLARGALLVAIVFAAYPEWSARHLPVPEFLNRRAVVLIVSATVFVVSAMRSAAAQRFLGSRPLRILGRLSFPLYLLHMPLLFSFSAWMIAAVDRQGIPYRLNILLSFLASWIVILLAAWLMAEAVDRPSIRFGKAWLQARLYPTLKMVSSPGEQAR